MLSLTVSHGKLRRSVPVLAAFVVGAIAYAPLYCYPLLAPQFESTFHSSRELGQMPWTMFLLISVLCSPLLGRAYDVIADRWLLMLGAVLLAAGWLVASVASDVAFLMAAYGAFLAIGVQLVFVGTTTAIARRYAGVAGLALGITYAGPGIGVALALPIAAGLIPQLGWRATAGIFGVMSLAAIPFVWLMTVGSGVMVPLGRGKHADAGSVALEAAPSSRGLHETSAPGAIAAAQRAYSRCHRGTPSPRASTRTSRPLCSPSSLMPTSPARSWAAGCRIASGADTSG